MRKTPIIPVLKHLIEADPRRAGASVEELEPKEAGTAMVALPAPLLFSLLRNVQPYIAGRALATLDAQRAGAVLEATDPQVAVDILRSMESKARTDISEVLSESKKQALRELTQFPADSAGRLMATDVVTFRPETKVREVISRLRAAVKKGSPPVYAYVVDDGRKLIGVLVMRDLLFASREAPVESVMSRSVKAVNGFVDREELVQLAKDKRYLAVPVVDVGGRLLGAIKTSELLESSQEEASEDLQLVFGASADEHPFSSVSFKVSRRLPWLQVNLATAFLAGIVVALFEGIIAKVSVLAVFLPIIAGQGGNAGTQTLAVILRGLIMREILPEHAGRAIAREIIVGGINGILTGIVTAVIAWLWKGNPVLGLVVGLAMLVNLVAAGAAGAAIPLAMKKMGFDPAQSSGIFLTTVTDVVGFFAFLGIATLFLPYLAG